MTFDNPEVVELGMAEELIRDEFDHETSESVMPSKIKLFSAVYVADAE
jgi:hypothetical protein